MEPLPPEVRPSLAPAPPAPRWWRVALRAVVNGVLPGALIYGAHFALCVAFHARAEYLGVEDEELTTRLVALFEDEILAHQLGLLATYLAIGAAVGLLAWTFVDLARRVDRRPYRPWRHLYWTATLIWAVHIWFLARSAATHPAIYEPQVDASLYLAVVFWLGTDVLPRWLLDTLGYAALATALGLGLTLLWRRGRRRLILSPGPRALPVAAGGALLGAAMALAAAPPAPPAPTARPNVVLIAVDSLRGDMLGLDPPVTPVIDAFAARAAAFDNAYSVMPRTFPAWASLLTGRYPHGHGVRHMFPVPRDGPVVSGSLGHILARAGYRTAVISDFAGEVFTRGDFGFQHVVAPEFTLRSNVRLGSLKIHVHLMPYLVGLFEGAGHPELLAFERLGDPRWLTRRALSWIGADDPRPFFLVVFYSSGHFPFASHAPFYDRFTEPGYRGRSRFHKATVGQPLEGLAREREEAHIRGLYKGAIAASDAAIGELLRGLEARGLFERSVIVVTADHGETLYEDGLGVGHGDHLYGRATLHVPLLLRWPGFPHEGRRVAASVPLVDVAPTVLGRIGLIPRPDLDGVDLAPSLAAPGPPPHRPVFAETGLTFFPPETHRVDDRIQFAAGFDAFRFDPETWEIYLDPRYEDMAILAKHRALIEGDWKLIYVPTRDGVRWELYDTARDPGDSHDLAALEPERLEAMRARLLAWMLEDPRLVHLSDYVAPRGPLGLDEAAP